MGLIVEIWETKYGRKSSVDVGQLKGERPCTLVVFFGRPEALNTSVMFEEFPTLCILEGGRDHFPLVNFPVSLEAKTQAFDSGFASPDFVSEASDRKMYCSILAWSEAATQSLQG